MQSSLLSFVVAAYEIYVTTKVAFQGVIRFGEEWLEGGTKSA